MRNKQKKLSTHALCLDFLKAINEVDHYILLKLYFLGVNALLLRTVSDYLNDRKQHILVEDCISSAFDV